MCSPGRSGQRAQRRPGTKRHRDTETRRISWFLSGSSTDADFIRAENDVLARSGGQRTQRRPGTKRHRDTETRRNSWFLCVSASPCLLVPAFSLRPRPPPRLISPESSPPPSGLVHHAPTRRARPAGAATSAARPPRLDRRACRRSAIRSIRRPQSMRGAGASETRDAAWDRSSMSRRLAGSRSRGQA